MRGKRKRENNRKHFVRVVFSWDLNELFFIFHGVAQAEISGKSCSVCFFFIDTADCPVVNICSFHSSMSGNNSVVECNLAKVDVASSNLVSRSI